MLTGDSFFHLAGLGAPGALAELNMCGAGRVVCLIDPVGDVYACPFAIHEVPRRQRLRRRVRRGLAEFRLFTELRRPQSAGACGSCGHYDSCRGGCMAAKFFTGLPIDGPDPECVQGYGGRRWPPTATPVPRRPLPDGAAQVGPPTRPACNESPV